jgi:hypothetical protein
MRITFSSYGSEEKRLAKTESINKKFFNAKYKEAQAETPFLDDLKDTQEVLGNIYDRIMENINLLNQSCISYYIPTPSVDPSRLGHRGIYGANGSNRATWLFFGATQKSIADKLADFIITKHDRNLTSGDYTLLFYVSLQD